MIDKTYHISALEMKAAAQRLPAAPEIFVKLGRLLKDPSAEMDDVTGLVMKDSSLVAKVVRLSNTAFFNTGEPIGSLEEAVNRIGFKELFRVVGMAALSNVFEVWNVAYKVDGDVVWHNSLAVGLAMEQLAAANGEDLGEAYTMGILRSLGKQVVDNCAKLHRTPPRFDPGLGAPLLLWEENTFGVTNAEACAFVLESWNFPEEAVVGMRFQYQPDLCHKANRYARMLNIAGAVAEKAGKPMPGESSYWNLSADCLAEAELTANHVRSATGYVTEKLKLILKAVSA